MTKLISSSSWFGLMMASSISKKKKNKKQKKNPSRSAKGEAVEKKKNNKKKKKKKKKRSPAIGVLAFEVAKLMSRTSHLWHSLSYSQLIRLRDETLRHKGVLEFVSDDDAFLLGLAFAESIESLASLVRSVSALGRRCNDPVLRHLGRVFSDLLSKNGSDPYGLQYAGTKIEWKVKKMERLVASTSSLYQELGVLAELEQASRKVQAISSNFRHKVLWQQRKEVKYLRQTSLWNRSYDYAVRLLARSLFTIVAKMNHFFGFRSAVEVGKPAAKLLPRSHSSSSAYGSTHTSVDVVSDSPLPPSWKHRSYRFRTSKRSVSSRSLGRCIAGESGDSCMPIDSGSGRSNATSRIPNGMKQQLHLLGPSMNLSQALLEPRRKLLDAPPSTLGFAALPLHYAKLIILIEKLAGSPHLIGQDARDDLYNMLPTSVRAALRARLKPCAKRLSSSDYDPILAAERSKDVRRILDWLTPLARNMIKWQSERSFEQQDLVSNTNVLLVTTLYFAHQAKTEAAITDLLIGLNYLGRFHKELNAQAIAMSE